MIFKERIFIHFNEADPAGILFFGHYFTKAHQAIEHLVQSLEIPWKDWFGNPNLGVPLHHVEAKYLRPLWAGQSYYIEVSVAQLTNSSVTFNYQIKDEENRLCSELKTVHVFIEVPKKEKIKIPTHIYKKLDEFQKST